jgi:uncharacterized coiled-coil DUF342 family protein
MSRPMTLYQDQLAIEECINQLREIIFFLMGETNLERTEEEIIENIKSLHYTAEDIEKAKEFAAEIKRSIKWE